MPLEKTWTLISQGFQLVYEHRNVLIKKGWFITAVTTLTGAFYAALSIATLLLQPIGVIQGEHGVVTTAATPPDWMLTLTPITLIIYWVLSLYLTAFFLKFFNDLFDKKEVKPESISHVFHSIIWVFLLMCVVILSGSLLFLIPGVIFGLWYYFSLSATIIDGKKGREALRYSHSLVRGRFWAVSVRLSLIMLYTTLLTGVAMIAFTVLVGLLISPLTQVLETQQGGVFILSVVIGIFFILLLFVIQIITTAPFVALYRNLKETLPQPQQSQEKIS
ncbi:MAG: hypothetical protein Q7R79_04620 [bacterium]|nr:hypothetical protein [bacterium]